MSVPPAAFFQPLDRPLGLPVPVPIVDLGLEQLKSDYERIDDPDARRVLREMARVLCDRFPLKRSL